MFDRAINRHKHLLITAGISRRQGGVSLPLSLVSDIDWLLAPAIPHALAVASLWHDILVTMDRTFWCLLTVLRARQEVRPFLLLVVWVVYVEVQIHVNIDGVKVVTVAITVTGRVSDARDRLCYWHHLIQIPLCLPELSLILVHWLIICGCSIVDGSVSMVSMGPLLLAVRNRCWKGWRSLLWIRIRL